MTPPRGYRPIFGKIHDCPKCGHPIQHVVRHKDRVFIEEADTGQNHVCSGRDAVGDLMICECGATLLIGGGARIDWKTGETHVCKPIAVPAPPVLRGLVGL